MFWGRLCLAIAGAALVIAGLRLSLPFARTGRPDTLRDFPLRRKLGEVCSRPWRVERFIYRHHRPFGGAIIAGALTLLYLLYAGHIQLAGIPAERLGMGLRTANLVSWAMAVAVLLIGFAMLIRPSLLKGIEALSNRWIQIPRPGARASRRIGILLILAGFACLGAAVRMTIA